MGTFLVLEPAFRAGKHVEGGGLMAVMLNLFALPCGLEASLVDFYSMVGEKWCTEVSLEDPDKNFILPRKSKVLHPTADKSFVWGHLCCERGPPHCSWRLK